MSTSRADAVREVVCASVRTKIGAEYYTRYEIYEEETKKAHVFT